MERHLSGHIRGSWWWRRRTGNKLNCYFQTPSIIPRFSSESWEFIYLGSTARMSGLPVFLIPTRRIKADVRNFEAAGCELWSLLPLWSASKNNFLRERHLQKISLEAFENKLSRFCSQKCFNFSDCDVVFRKFLAKTKFFFRNVFSVPRRRLITSMSYINNTN